MNRNVWTYKKLGELTQTISGLWTGKKPPFRNIAVIRNTNFTKDCVLNLSNVAFIDVEERQFATRKLQKGDIIIEKSGGSDKQPVGRPVIFDIDEGDYSFSNFTSTLRILNQEEILPSFLHKVLLSKYRMGVTLKMQSKTTGLHNLDFKAYNNIIIPLPTKEEQTQIISELDSLNDSITMLQQQVTDLETLAQSLFYDMFGDPIENPKHWSVMEMCKVAPCKSYTGVIEPNDGKFWLLNLDMVESQSGKIIGKYYCDLSEVGNSTTTFCEDNVLYSKLRPYLNKVVVPNGKGYCTSELLPLLPQKDVLNRLFLAYLLRSTSFVNYISNRVAGAKMPRVSMNDFRCFNVIIPPLPLQQTFADKIAIIDESKSSLNAQITEMQNLLASRMQYWFD